VIAVLSQMVVGPLSLKVSSENCCVMLPITFLDADNQYIFREKDMLYGLSTEYDISSSATKKTTQNSFLNCILF
jgi:hypothetical protein